ncbi:Uncharacterized protein APZ42_000632 [Daphnia magna]|uniref:Uncharacterized protein n=1 Tax=Daphnia magna TaxID=35525 RepID=A0A164JHL5_9CRUS|nr:Uncharacterized protein APZ42_000632 [Daphnia magna]
MLVIYAENNLLKCHFKKTLQSLNDLQKILWQLDDAIMQLDASSCYIWQHSHSGCGNN